MGRHTKLADDLEGDQLADDAVADVADVAEDAEESGGRLSWLTKVPLLPAIAGISAIGVVTAAWSTSQISLNFGGGAPSHAEQPQSGAQGGSNARRGADDRTSRSDRTSTVTIAFRATSRSATGFKATATIVNRGAQPINGWTLAFHIPNAHILSASNVVLVKPGSVATVRNMAQLPTIAPGRSVRVVFTAQGAASRPSACRFNGVPCTLT